VTLEYDQQLTFLPGALRGLGLRGSITKIDPDGERVNMPKTSANWGLRYSYGKFDVQLTGNAQSKYRTSALSNTATTANNGILYHAARELWNISASYKINRQFEVMLAGRNIFNAPDVIYSNVAAGCSSTASTARCGTSGSRAPSSAPDPTVAAPSPPSARPFLSSSPKFQSRTVMVLNIDRRRLILARGLAWARRAARRPAARWPQVLGATGFTHSVASGEPGRTPCCCGPATSRRPATTCSARGRGGARSNFTKVVSGGSVRTGAFATGPRRSPSMG
jgi:hypothetical protein